MWFFPQLNYLYYQQVIFFSIDVIIS
jgi:hypothetical protein